MIISDKIRKGSNYICMVICDECDIKFDGTYHVYIKRDKHLCNSCSKKYNKNAFIPSIEMQKIIINRSNNLPINSILPKQESIRMDVVCCKCGKVYNTNARIFRDRFPNLLCRACVCKNNRLNPNNKCNTLDYKINMSKSVKYSINHIKSRQSISNKVKEYRKSLRNGIELKDLLSDFKLYRRMVSSQTGISYRKYEDVLNPNGLSFGRKTYHLDHKYSVFEGFKDNIPPYIIGSVYNLEILSSADNMSKNIKCSITKEELFDKFFNDYYEALESNYGS